MIFKYGYTKYFVISDNFHIQNTRKKREKDSSLSNIDSQNHKLYLPLLGYAFRQQLLALT